MQVSTNESKNFLELSSWKPSSLNLSRKSKFWSSGAQSIVTAHSVINITYSYLSRLFQDKYCFPTLSLHFVFEIKFHVNLQAKNWKEVIPTTVSLTRVLERAFILVWHWLTIIQIPFSILEHLCYSNSWSQIFRLFAFA